MSVTVSDCLKVPALRKGKVVAGEKGLNKIVTSCSVLEYANHSMLVDELFLGNELVISALTSVKDDVDGQCAAIRRLWETGEVGLIIYYVGIFVQNLDQRLLSLADELGFPIICMPSDSLDYRYSEALSEVFELIFKDNVEKADFVSDTIDIIAQLAERQKNIQSVLRILSDRLHSTLMLFDYSFSKSCAANWPMAAEWDREELSDYYHAHKSEMEPDTAFEIQLSGVPVNLRYVCVKHSTQPDMVLFSFTEKEPVSTLMLKQAAEVIQMSMSIWKLDFASEGQDELVLAILNNDPLHMRKIAAQLHIDIASIHTMWIFKANDPSVVESQFRRYVAIVKLFLKEHRKLALVDTVEDTIVAFMDDAPYAELDAGLAEDFIKTLNSTEEKFRLVVCGSLADTVAVRRAYAMSEKSWHTVCGIYPTRSLLTFRELAFAEECEVIIQRGEEYTAMLMQPLEPLFGMEEKDELANTLATFLLDANSNSKEAGDLLHIHKNTVNYRINKIKKCLGYDVTKMPEAYALYRAIALHRLLNENNEKEILRIYHGSK